MDVKELAALLGDRFDKLETKVDAVKDAQAIMGNTLTAQAAQLGEHMRRSEANEKRIEQVDQAAKAEATAIRGDLRPLQEAKQRFTGAIAVLGGVGGLGAIVIELLHRLF